MLTVGQHVGESENHHIQAGKNSAPTATATMAKLDRAIDGTQNRVAHNAAVIFRRQAAADV